MRRSALALIAALLLALTAAGTVSAHTPNVTLTCDGGLKVVLTAYNAGGTNTVAVSIDGTPVDGSPFSFGGSYSASWPVLPATEAHTAKVAVNAWDDPTGASGWTKTFNLEIPACQKPTPTPTVAPTPTPTVAPTATPTEAPTATPSPNNPTPTPTEVAQTPQPTPTGTVEAATGTPKVTPPATDTTPASGGGPGTGLALVLALLAGSLLALVPAARRRTGTR